MKQYLVLGMFTVGIYVAGPAIAVGDEADRYSWKGAYVGADLDYGWGSGRGFEPAEVTPPLFINIKPQTLKTNPNGFAVGPYGGYNWQYGNIVYGGEISGSLSNLNGSTATAPLPTALGPSPSFGAGSYLSTKEHVGSIGAFRGRIGYSPLNHLLIYGTGGLALAEIRYEAAAAFSPLLIYTSDFSKTQLGWTGGLGAEYAIGSKWSVRAECSYYKFGNEISPISTSPGNFALPLRADFKSGINIGRLGLSYKFN